MYCSVYRALVFLLAGVYQREGLAEACVVVEARDILPIALKFDF